MVAPNTKAKITSKGQLTIPQAVRERMGLAPGDRVDFIFHDDGHVEIKPVRHSIKRLIGILPRPARTATVEDMQRAIEEGACRRAARARRDDRGDAA